MQLVDDLELLAVRANGSINGLRVLEPLSANKGKTDLCYYISSHMEHGSFQIEGYSICIANRSLVTVLLESGIET